MKKNVVYYISIIFLMIIVMWGTFFADSFQSAVDGSFDFITKYFTNYYLIVMSLFVVFCFYMLLSKHRNVKLGDDDSKPEYSFVSWFAMLFSAGMGIGLVFWGVAEPINHYLAPAQGIASGSEEAMRFAVERSYLHWGLHPWAGYVVIGGALAYVQFRKKQRGLISSLLIPLIGEKRARGPLGNLIDIIAIFATVAGIATSLGLGAYQINSGLNFLFGVPENNLVVLIIVLVTTGLFILSAVSGLDRGIKILSNTNIALAFVIMVLCFIVGPTVLIIKNIGVGSFDYLTHLIPNMVTLQKADGKEWLGSWTVFYWAWWIAWAPFVGSFIARISKGRTIKEFVTGVLFAPLLASIVWFAIFGSLGMNLSNDIIAEAASNTSTAVFVTLSHYKLGALISGIIIILLCTFFVTSADSGTFVLGILSSDGDLNPTTLRKVIWGVVITSVTLVLMFASDSGLANVQRASIVAALPFSVVMLFSIVAWLKSLFAEKK